ncbi:MAG: hypothetical protein RL333_497 [Pseudomonadota bacterium]|jgi:hypothetical protein
MTMRLSNSPVLLANPLRARDLTRKDYITAGDDSETLGILKRFERFISPNLTGTTVPPEDLLDAFIQRNSWLR